MRLKRTLALLMTVGIVISLVPPLPLVEAAIPFVEQRFDTPIDAFSVRAENEDLDAQYSYLRGKEWSDWEEILTDFDGKFGLHESQLVMLPYGVTALRVRGIEVQGDIHPITVSKLPVSVLTTSLVAVSKQPILSRSDWGADESLLFQEPVAQEAPVADIGKGDTGGTTSPPGRLTECDEAQKKYPEEFKTSSVVTKDSKGRTYSWPLSYSKSVRLLSVHHTALKITGDPRPAVERVRALYKYHAANRGWGDIGYHFLIDEEGQIYEGRQGGKSVVGGHAYCNNVGSIGIVLLGHFDLEQPTQKQVQSLQWLLESQAKTYGIDVQKSLQFHGKALVSPIVRHKDLLSTACPGYYLSEVFGQIVRNVQQGRLEATVTFPVITKSSSSASTIPVPSGVAPGVGFPGRTEISMNPGGMQRLSFTYTAERGGAYEGKKIADVSLGHPDVQLWIDNGKNRIPIRTGVLVPSDLPEAETLSFQLIVQSPMNSGTYFMTIGGVRFKLNVAGRRARTGEYYNPFSGNKALIVEPPTTKKVSTPLKPQVRVQSRPSMQSSSSARSISTTVETRDSRVSTTVDSPLIRIRLSASQNPSVVFTSAGELGGTPVRAGTTVDLLPLNGRCEARLRGERLVSGDTVQFATKGTDTLTVHGVASKTRSYRGVLECRVVNGTLALINELPLEDYMAGLAEEPDTEPYEKQRAFVVAARTYALFYIKAQGTNRKFPGLPYDGSDDPATFQAYAGANYEALNPNWTRAVLSTAGNVLTYKNELFKPAYFSSDDGKTRTPLEAGWKNFPAAEIFNSKPDPWCIGMTFRGHGVGMSGCGALGQAKEGRSAEQILQYYYPGTRISDAR